MYDIEFDDGEVHRAVSHIYMKVPQEGSSLEKPNSNIHRPQVEKFKVGQTVICELDEWSRAHRGKIVQDNGDNTYNIKFKSGEVVDFVEWDEIKPVDLEAEKKKKKKR